MKSRLCLKKMTGYKIVHLKNLINEIGEEETKNILSDFSCPKNPDVETFLKQKAIIFAKQDVSQTHLVFASYQGGPALIGYFTLALKYIQVSGKNLNAKWRRRLARFAPFNEDIKGYCIAAPLIGQLGKNFAHGYNDLISGDELLKMACDKIFKILWEVGGKMAYLECEDKEKLLNFYTSNGFWQFGKRRLERDETNLEGEYLIQLIKYIEND